MKAPRQLRELVILERTVRAALTPRPLARATDEERANEVLFRMRQCYACLAVVDAERGVEWRLGKTTGHTFIFHSECAARALEAHPAVPLRTVLAAVRERREAK